MKKIKIGIISLVTISVILLCIPGNASAQYWPVVEFKFTDSPQTVDVEPGANYTVVFHGTLSTHCDNPLTVDFEIKRSTNAADWTVALSPSSISLPPGDNDRDVTLSVWVPPETSSKISGNIEVTARGWVYGSFGGTEGKDTVQVHVKPYYKLSIASSEAYQEVTPHSKASFKFNIQNVGNTVINDLTVSVETPSGWRPIYPTSSIYINEKEIQSVIISVETPQEWTLWKDKPERINITVSSTQAGISENYNVYVREKGTYIPGFDPIFVIVAFGIALAILGKRVKHA
ncbi:MAG: hypothetical protein QMC80_05080 [Thermoplasmatales archaeon]|nr:hypothetical protein [Thermoplasmatales archaeon]